LAGQLAGRPCECGVVDAVGEFGVVSVADEAGVVDPGRRRRVGWGLGAGLDVGVAPDAVRDRRPRLDAAQPDRDVGEVEGVEHQLDPVPDQQRIDLARPTPRAGQDLASVLRSPAVVVSLPFPAVPSRSPVDAACPVY
jgi:hypothetical protein